MTGPGGPGGPGGPDGAPACELCQAARLTPWHHEDELCWVADCESCDVPMVAARAHGPTPPEEAVAHMLAQLGRVAEGRYGTDGFWVDRLMRQIPDHFHAHARPRRPAWGGA